MTFKQIALSGLALSVIGSIATVGMVKAYQGDPSVQGPNYSPDRHEAMEAAFDNYDYEAWADLMAGRGRVTQVVTADNFSTFVEAHNLAEAGDLEGAAALRAQLGLGTGMGPNAAQSQGNGYGRNR